MDTRYTYRNIRLRVKKEVKKKSSRSVEDLSYEDADNFCLVEHLLTGKVLYLIVHIIIAQAKVVKLSLIVYFCFKFYFK